MYIIFFKNTQFYLKQVKDLQSAGRKISDFQLFCIVNSCLAAVQVKEKDKRIAEQSKEINSKRQEDKEKDKRIAQKSKEINLKRDEVKEKGPEKMCKIRKLIEKDKKLKRKTKELLSKVR